jgi:hypothetical protein
MGFFGCWMCCLWFIFALNKIDLTILGLYNIIALLLYLLFNFTGFCLIFGWFSFNLWFILGFIIILLKSFDFQRSIRINTLFEFLGRTTFILFPGVIAFLDLS